MKEPIPPSPVNVGDAWHFKTSQRNVWVSDVVTRRGESVVVVWPETAPIGERQSFPLGEFWRLCARGYVKR